MQTDKVKRLDDIVTLITADPGSKLNEAEPFGRVIPADCYSMTKPA
ncbi:MAG: hypothetical protein WA435_12925 [Gallionellaceae bacterium]